MIIETHAKDDVTIVQFKGKLDTNTTPDAETKLMAIVNDGCGKILVDFQKLDFVSSAGLRILLVTAKKLGTTGGSLRVCGLNETVRDIFDISGFSTLLKVFDNEQDALAGF